MAKRSKLLSALDAHRGRDFEKERQQKLQKTAAKRKRSKAAAEEKSEDNEVDGGTVGLLYYAMGCNLIRAIANSTNRN